MCVARLSSLSSLKSAMWMEGNSLFQVMIKHRCVVLRGLHNLQQEAAFQPALHDVINMDSCHVTTCVIFMAEEHQAAGRLP